MNSEDRNSLSVNHNGKPLNLSIKDAAVIMHLHTSTPATSCAWIRRTAVTVAAAEPAGTSSASEVPVDNQRTVSDAD
ncbi:hypothetical protein YC2023_024473 [Brassica napus]